MCQRRLKKTQNSQPIHLLTYHALIKTSVLGDVAITFVTPNIVGALCTEEHPYAAHGPWLQVSFSSQYVTYTMTLLL